mmetsp:Transcript_16241/g.23508  ORF Transcript_16241/g.23508 Transcript_16241/m.23508 type:complete len:193 (-) Transcript_16241:34-612(-)
MQEKSIFEPKDRTDFLSLSRHSRLIKSALGSLTPAPVPKRIQGPASNSFKFNRLKRISGRPLGSKCPFSPVVHEQKHQKSSRSLSRCSTYENTPVKKASLKKTPKFTDRKQEVFFSEHTLETSDLKVDLSKYYPQFMPNKPIKSQRTNFPSLNSQKKRLKPNLLKSVQETLIHPSRHPQFISMLQNTKLSYK